MSKLNREQSIQLLKHCVKGNICDQCKERDTKKCILTMLDKIMNDEVPTVDVVEVRHGEWIDKPTGAYSRMQSWCSACGKHSGIGGIESNRHKPYCPNCGAKMDGERIEYGN